MRTALFEKASRLAAARWRAPASFALVAVVLLVANGCKTDSTDMAGSAYIAPASINLHPSLTDRNKSVAVLSHGDRVQILEVRRRFAKIHTAKGVDGWIDSAQLLTPDQMKEIREARSRALAMPSEGSATVLEALNIHIDPSRQSPAFAKIPEAGSVDVLAHRLEPKVTGPPKIPVFALPQNTEEIARKERRERRARNSFRIPARPPAPKPPENWLGLSHAQPDATPAAAVVPKLRPVPKEEVQKPVPVEDWSLVRTRDKQCGWVLSGNLIMSIPDEVAQYAEGKRITSYFDLGLVQDEEKGPRHHWLWTTSSRQEQTDFDGWRVFLWNRRRHRYETSHRERDVEGFFPVHVDPPDSSTPLRAFYLITRDDKGKLVRKRYLFDGVRVHLAGQEAYGDLTPQNIPVTVASGTPSQQRNGNWLRSKWEALRKRLGGN